MNGDDRNIELCLNDLKTNPWGPMIGGREAQLNFWHRRSSQQVTFSDFKFIIAEREGKPQPHPMDGLSETQLQAITDFVNQKMEAEYERGWIEGHKAGRDERY